MFARYPLPALFRSRPAARSRTLPLFLSLSPSASRSRPPFPAPFPRLAREIYDRMSWDSDSAALRAIKSSRRELREETPGLTHAGSGSCSVSRALCTAEDEITTIKGRNYNCQARGTCSSFVSPPPRSRSACLTFLRGRIVFDAGIVTVRRFQTPF